MTRKEQLQEIEERLKNGVEEYFTSEKYASLEGVKNLVSLARASF